MNRTVGSSTRFAFGRQYGVELPSRIFDPLRADRILTFLLEERLAERRQLHRVMMPASLRTLCTVHSVDYLEQVQSRGAMAGILGFEISDELQDRFLTSHRLQVAGTIWAARWALTSGAIAVNLGGGFHHASAERGEGFCVFNDLALAIADRRAAGFRGRVLVIDLDLHDGDGTRQIFAEDASVHTLSIHNRDLGSAEAVASTSVALGDGVEDEPYLRALDATLTGLVEAFRPRLAVYVAGCDPAHDDRLGNWEISPRALLERDRRVMEVLRGGSKPVPTVIVLGGGYGRHAWRYSARFFSTLAHSGRPVEPPETRWYRMQHYRRIARLLTPVELTHEPETDWQLTEEDLDPAAASRSRGARFLDYYSRHGVELVLERTGLLGELRRRGHETLSVELELDQRHEHTLKIVSAEARGESLIELRARKDARTIPGMTLLWIEWLLLQDPLAGFGAARPALPGQRYPGLALLGDVSALLVLMCERLGLDGLGFVPSHYGIAAQARSYFRFVDGDAHARFVALREALGEMRLVDAIEVIEQGRVRERTTGATFRWQPSPMIVPVSERLRELLSRREAQAEDDATRRRYEYELVELENGNAKRRD